MDWNLFPRLLKSPKLVKKWMSFPPGSYRRSGYHFAKGSRNQVQKPLKGTLLRPKQKTFCSCIFWGTCILLVNSSNVHRSLSVSYYANDDVYRICTWILNEYGPELCITKTGPSLVLKCIRHYEKELERPRISFERFISTLIDRFHVKFRPYKTDLESVLTGTFSPAINREIINKLA